MVTLAAAASIVVYVLPLIVLLAAKSFRRRSAWEIALDIPFSLCVDLLLVLSLTFFMRLETATLLSRALWVAGGATVVWNRRRAGSAWVLPELSREQVVGVLASIALAVLVSMSISRTYQIWDRYWHLALVPSLRGQKLPFFNVYEPGAPFSYHFAADAMAAMLQSLSFCTISSDMALAEAHDIAFAYIGATISLLAAGLSQLRALPIALTGPALVLHGPVLLRGQSGNLGVPFHGYSYSHFLTNSFRPHIALAGVMLTGFAGTVAVRMRQPTTIPWGRTFPTLCATSVAMAITDEPSVVMVGLAVFVAWLIHADVIAPRRTSGLAALAGLGAAVVFARWLFAGIRGGPVYKVAWVPGRIPGMQLGSITGLYTRDGLIVLACDFFPFLLATLGLLLAFLAQRNGRLAAVLAFSGACMALCFVGITHIEVNNSPSEGVRYLVAPCFVALTCALLWLPRVPRHSLARATIVAALVVPAVFTIYWVCERADTELGPYTLRGPFGKTPFGAYGLSCRDLAGARLGEAAEITYIDTTAWYRYASCRPIYAPGMFMPTWKVKIAPRGQNFPNTQLDDVEAMVGPSATIRAACLPAGQGSDPVCSYALGSSSCRPDGTDFVRCELTPRDREELRRLHVVENWQ